MKFFPQKVLAYFRKAKKTFEIIKKLQVNNILVSFKQPTNAMINI